ncbi:hypothetical protein ACWPKO_18840 (plasmid) [Coraliomargarita sp. W4R53]
MKRTGVIAIAAGAAVVVGVVAGISWMLLRTTGAEPTAQQYLDALAGGDGAAAVALIADAPSGDIELAAALSEATELLVEPKITAITEADTTATASFTFSLAGATIAGTFDLAKAGDGWFINNDALGEVVATSSVGDSVTIANVIVAIGTKVALLPASYEVAPAPVGILEGAATAHVSPGRLSAVQTTATLSSDAAAAAQAQLDAYVDGCAVPAPAVPEHCGIRIPWAVDLVSLDEVAFRVESYPVIALSENAASFTATAGELVATATGTTRDGDEESFTYRADDWALQGNVSFKGNEMVLSVY